MSEQNLGQYGLQQQGYGPPPQYGQVDQQPGGRTTTGWSRIWCGFLWYLLVVAVLGTVVMLSQAVSATSSGHDPTLGAHPVSTDATVEDYDVSSCTRGGSCQYDEKVTFGTATGTQTVTIKDVDTRPTIGGTLTVWYPAGDPAVAQTDGPHSATFYWGAAVGFGVVAFLMVYVVIRRRRSTS